MFELSCSRFLNFFFIISFRKNAELRRMNDAISDGIITLYSAAQMDLTQGLARCFGWNLAYDTLLDKVDELFAKHPSLVSHEVHSAIKFLQEQDKFYRQYRTFYSGHWLKPPYVKVIERIIESMKIIAGRLGLSNCVKKIGSLLYDVNGAEMQLLRGERVVVHRENSCATNQHLELSKIALFLAHSPPDSEVLERT